VLKAVSTQRRWQSEATGTLEFAGFQSIKQFHYTPDTIQINWCTDIQNKDI